MDSAKSSVQGLDPAKLSPSFPLYSMETLAVGKEGPPSGWLVLLRASLAKWLKVLSEVQIVYRLGDTLCPVMAALSTTRVS